MDGCQKRVVVSSIRRSRERDVIRDNAGTRSMEPIDQLGVQAAAKGPAAQLPERRGIDTNDHDVLTGVFLSPYREVRIDDGEFRALDGARLGRDEGEGD